MRMDRFTIKAQEALQGAQSLAEQLGNQELEPENLLSVLLSQEDGVVLPLLKKLGTNVAALRATVEERLNRFPKVSGAGGGTYISSRFKSVLDQSEKEAEQFKDEFVGAEHFLLAMLTSKTEAAKILSAAGIKRDALLKSLQEIRGNQRITDPNAEDKYQVLEKYCRDLTANARQGKLDPVI